MTSLLTVRSHFFTYSILHRTVYLHISSGTNLDDIEKVLSLVSAPNLKKLCKDFNLRPQGGQKTDCINELLSHAKKKTFSFAKDSGTNVLHQKIMQKWGKHIKGRILCHWNSITSLERGHYLAIATSWRMSREAFSYESFRSTHSPTGGRRESPVKAGHPNNSPHCSSKTQAKSSILPTILSGSDTSSGTGTTCSRLKMPVRLRQPSQRLPTPRTTPWLSPSPRKPLSPNFQGYFIVATLLD